MGRPRTLNTTLLTTRCTWALAALLGGCGPGVLLDWTGDDGTGAHAEDAGRVAHRDAGSREHDGGSTHTTEPVDAGGAPDSGSTDDAGTARDSGSADAGSAPDSGSPDAGKPDATDGGSPLFNPCPSTGDCRIMPLGDSITDGVPGGGGYRVELFRRATLDGRALTYVGSRRNGPSSVDGHAFPQNHEGYSGYTIDDAPGKSGIYPLVERALKNSTPNIVLLMIGTNDLTANLELPKAPARLGLLIDRIAATSPNALVVVAKIIPSTQDGLNANIRTYNEGIARVVSERLAAGKHVLLVDQYEPFIQNAGFKTQWMADWLHPTADGYATMARVWYAAIKPFLSPT